MSLEHLPRLSLLTTLALLSAGAVAMPATAQLDGLGSESGLSRDLLNNEPPLSEPPPDIGPQPEERPRAPLHLNRAQAAAQARDLHGGRVLSVHWTGNGYRVKLLRHGEVRIVRVADAPPEKEKKDQ
jgi:hypothetical protein